MKTYLIIEKYQGVETGRLRISAKDALTAINLAEEGAPARRLSMGDKIVHWTGYEYVARQVIEFERAMLVPCRGHVIDDEMDY